MTTTHARATTITSMLLASTDPDRLRRFYATVFDPVANDDMRQYGILLFGNFCLMIDKRDDIGPANAEGPRVILNFEVADAGATAARMAEWGAQWVSELEDRDGSLFGTTVDPDGNYVQFIQLSEAERASMGR
jgi:predicted enzyme related to lactoylglutathione lyase